MRRNVMEQHRISRVRRDGMERCRKAYSSNTGPTEIKTFLVKEFAVAPERYSGNCKISGGSWNGMVRHRKLDLTENGMRRHMIFLPALNSLEVLSVIALAVDVEFAFTSVKCTFKAPFCIST